MFKPAVTVLVCAAILSGCATTREERLAGYQAQCSTYGFKQGTDAFANCIQQLDASERQRDAVEGAALTAAGMRMISNSTPRPVTPTSCTYRTFGNSVTQTCL